MKNTKFVRKGPKGYFLAFLIAALVFLAVGLGTLGSVRGTGNAFELMTKLGTSTEAEEQPGVVFRLTNPTEPNGEGGTTTVNLRLVAVHLNIAIIYGDPGTPAKFRVERSYSGTSTSFSSPIDCVVENFYTPTADLDENGKPVQDIPAPDATDAFFRYVSPFSFGDGWRVSTYPYVKLQLKSDSPNVLLNEVVFVGERLDSDSKPTGKLQVVPATVYSATPYGNESSETAKKRAEALLDAQTMPAGAQSTFDVFSADEIYTLMTISEMRRGSEFASTNDNVATDAYTIDGVYGAFGHDILALGTAVFGMSPFGLRFFPMLAAFGALLILARLITKLMKSEKAGFVFTLLYSLSCITLGYGHLGTPLMLGVFFFACALGLTYRFYANGMKRASVLSALPLLFAGLFGAAAMCVDGAFLIPLVGVIALFVAGMVRQQTAKRYHLEKAAEAEAAPAPENEATEDAEDTPALRVGRVAAEYKFRNRAAPVMFFVGLVLGTFLLALLGMLPAYFTYVKFYDDPAAPTMNVFALAWKTFANGFAGSNAYGAGTPWNIFRTVYSGTNYMHAVTMIALNPVALAAGAAGLAYGIYRLIILLGVKERDKVWRAEMRRVCILLCGLAVTLVAALTVRECAPFVLLLYLFYFLLASCLFGASFEGKLATPMKVVNVVGLVLLVLGFAALAVFTFSIPLPATFLTAILG